MGNLSNVYLSKIYSLVIYHKYEKSPCSMEKYGKIGYSAIPMFIFHSKLLLDQKDCSTKNEEIDH